MLKVVYFKTNEDSPRVHEIPHTLKDMQALVGGLLEVVSADCFGNNDPRLKDLIIWLNEEGRLLQLPANININPQMPDPFHNTIYGDIFVTGETENGETTSLPSERIEGVISALKGLRKGIHF